MDPRIRKRILMFYIAGVINVILGTYVLIGGAKVLPPGKVTTLTLFFFVFAAVDFYFPYLIKRKLREAQDKAKQAGPGQAGNP